MEALVAIGLASNVLSFVDFATKLVKTARGLRSDASLPEHEDLHVTTTNLRLLAEKIRASVQSTSQALATLSEEEKALQPVADGCCKLAEDLLQRLGKLGISSHQNHNLFPRIKTALKCIWTKREIEEIAIRLQHFRSQVAVQMTYQIKQAQHQQALTQSTKDDFQGLLDKIKELQLQIEALTAGLDQRADVRHSQVLRSIAELKDHSSQLDADAAQRAFEASHSIESRFDALQSLIASESVEIRSQQSQILDSFARASVENSRFRAEITHVKSPFDWNVTMIQALRPLLEEYQEKLLEGVRKEFRGTARSELDHSKAALERIFAHEHTQYADINTFESRSPLHHDAYISDEYKITVQSERVQLQPNSSAPTEGIRSHQLQKEDITFLHSNWYWKPTRIGSFSVTTRHKSFFYPERPPSTVYELTLQFTPSPNWLLSTGCTLSYRNTADARGSPERGLKLETFRVLDGNHHVWDVMAEGSIDSFRSMLAQKVILPSDRDHRGKPLLSVAVMYGRLDYVKALVQSGADINARDSYRQDTPLRWALFHWVSYGHSQRAEIFHYLYGLSDIDQSDLWMEEEIVIGVIFSLMLSCTDNPVSRASRTFKDGPSDNLGNAIHSLLSACQVADIDLDIPGERSFWETFLQWTGPPRNSSTNLFDATILTSIFDQMRREATRRNIRVSTEMCVPQSMVYLWLHIYMTNSNSTPLFTYRGHLVSHHSHTRLLFLEYVISRGIAQQPESIFNFPVIMQRPKIIFTLHEEIPYIFEDIWLGAFRNVWFGILADNGIDPNWALAEQMRRINRAQGETSTHDVNPDGNFAHVHEVKRRVGYSITED